MPIKFVFETFIVFIISDDKAPATFKFHIFMNSQIGIFPSFV